MGHALKGTRRRPPALLTFAALLALTLTGPATSATSATGVPSEAALFVDATTSSGLGSTHHFCPQDGDRGYLVTGQAWGDADGDGVADLYLTNQCGPSTLFRGLGNGRFEPSPLTGRVALGDRQSGGAVFADLDGDGWSDLLVLTYDGPVLFHNDQGRDFSDVTAASGISAITGAHPVSAALADYDRDGALDVFVANYGCVQCLPGPRDEVRSQLLHNRGDGHFEDVSSLLDPVGPLGFSLAARWGDFDNDGDPDLYVTNDVRGGRTLHGNALYRNDGPGPSGWCFSDVTLASGAGARADAMGLAVADLNGDGALDIFITNSGWAYTPLTGPSILLANQGDGTFRDVAAASGAAVDAMGWGVTALDADSNGWTDLYVALGTDPAGQGGLATTNRLLLNTGLGRFTDLGTASGAADAADSFGAVTGDANGDGQADIVVGDYNEGYRLFLGTGGGATAGHRLVVRLRGAGPVNRDAVGARIEVVLSNGRRLVHEIALGGTLGGNDDPAFRTGTGTATVSQLKVRWPDGSDQVMGDVPANSEILWTYGTEPQVRPLPPIAASALLPDAGATSAQGLLTPLIVGGAGVLGVLVLWLAWGRRGAASGAAPDRSRRRVRGTPRWAVVAMLAVVAVGGGAALALVQPPAQRPAHVADVHPEWSVARRWDEALLDAIRRALPAPTVHARNLFHVSVAMWDAWAAYDPNASGYLVHEKHGARDVAAARNEAISYAAYRVLTSRYLKSVGANESLGEFADVMGAMGYPLDVTTTEGDTPAALGNRIAAAVIAFGLGDGSNQANGYAAPDYQPINPPLVVAGSGTTMTDPNRWQPLQIEHMISQNGIPVTNGVQQNVGPHWGHVAGFALPDGGTAGLPIDPGPPPRLGDAASDQAFKDQAVEVIRDSSQLDADEGIMIDVSPGVRGANTLGTNDGHGHPVNPVTGQPYAADVVNQGDFARALTEFWADGPRSETPPGHWNVIANTVSDELAPQLEIGGSGPVVDRLEWDVKLYLALNGANHDAAVAAWGLKGHYDSARPISMIRYMGGLGQSSDPALPSYNPEGLPLVPGLVELVTTATAAPGQRHAALAGHEGEIAIRAWTGNAADPRTQSGGVGWILAVDWVPYQLPTFVTPSFPGYVSGHSAFSRASAEVLAAFTGSEFVPGGLDTWTTRASSLKVEPGPTRDVTLQWATYGDAADLAGLSRLYGGIHISADDFTGRRLGAACGKAAWARAQLYYAGLVQP